MDAPSFLCKKHGKLCPAMKGNTKSATKAEYEAAKKYWRCAMLAAGIRLRRLAKTTAN